MMDWIDNADSYICPVCGKEVSSPSKYLGCMCPKCGFQAEKDKYLNIEELNSTAISNLQAENEKLRAELEQVKRERDTAVSWAMLEKRLLKGE